MVSGSAKVRYGMISPIQRVEDPDVRPQLEQRRRDRDLREGRDRQHDGEDHELARAASAAPARRRRTTRRRARAPSCVSATTALLRSALVKSGFLKIVLVVLERRVRREQARRLQVVARLQRDVDQPVEREQAEDDDRGHGDPHPPRRLRRGRVACFLVFARARVAACGAVAAPASIAYSSASPRRLPPTKRMYEKETIITTMNVRIAMAEPEPVDPVRGERLLRDRRQRRRPVLALGQHVRQVEDPQRVQRAEDQRHEDRRRQQRQRDAREALPRRGAVDLGRLVDLAGYHLQPGEDAAAP